MMGDLFAEQIEPYRTPVFIAPGAAILRGFALPEADQLMQGVDAVVAIAPLRHLVTPGGKTMSVAMSNCGPLGWTSDRHGYRYTTCDPLSGQPWPILPDGFLAVAQRAAQEAGFADFAPNACLINRYQTGARMGLHQDRDEGNIGRSAAGDAAPPIVSISLGLPAVFLFGGLHRQAPTTRWPLAHGDVVVWGGPARLAFHGVAALKDGEHPQLGPQRVNLTFRCVAHGR